MIVIIILLVVAVVWLIQIARELHAANENAAEVEIRTIHRHTALIRHLQALDKS